LREVGRKGKSIQAVGIRTQGNINPFREEKRTRCPNIFKTVRQTTKTLDVALKKKTKQHKQRRFGLDDATLLKGELSLKRTQRSWINRFGSVFGKKHLNSGAGNREKAARLLLELRQLRKPIKGGSIASGSNQRGKGERTSKKHDERGVCVTRSPKSKRINTSEQRGE